MVDSNKKKCLYVEMATKFSFFANVNSGSVLLILFLFFFVEKAHV